MITMKRAMIAFSFLVFSFALGCGTPATPPDTDAGDLPDSGAAVPDGGGSIDAGEVPDGGGGGSDLWDQALWDQASWGP